MKPSSSRSEQGSGGPTSGLFDGVLARGAVREIAGDLAFLQAMLDFEAALASASAAAGRVDADAARAIGEAGRVDRFDIGRLGIRAADTGNPVVPMLDALRELVGPEAAGAVHAGATSQDVIDTAAMLVAGRAIDAIVGDLRGAADAAARLAERHRASLMPGRTLLQRATPVTFGLTAAGWCTGLDEATARLEVVRRHRLAVQLGGGTGTLAALWPDGPAIAAEVAHRLGLAEPVLPWHTDRTRVGELAGALAGACGAAAKPAQDVVLLAQTEIAEVREGTPGRGGSSAIPGKSNPVAAVSTLACARRAPGLVAELLGAGVHELERAAGAWHAEWLPLRELLVATGSAASWIADCLGSLVVDDERMLANLRGDDPPDLADEANVVAACEALVQRALDAHGEPRP
ncbi:MAG TPA: lyase family protein [Actinomycetota bacterium]|nr:lyase family protein [Actinomycetota bacterium]